MHLSFFKLKKKKNGIVVMELLDVNLVWDGTNMYRSGLFGLKQLCDMKQLLLYSVCGCHSLIIDPHKLADSFNESENKCYDFFSDTNF